MKISQPVNLNLKKCLSNAPLKEYLRKKHNLIYKNSVKLAEMMHNRWIYKLKQLIMTKTINKYKSLFELIRKAQYVKLILLIRTKINKNNKKKNTKEKIFIKKIGLNQKFLSVQWRMRLISLVSFLMVIFQKISKLYMMKMFLLSLRIFMKIFKILILIRIKLWKSPTKKK